MNAFRAMPEGLTKYHIPRAIFKLTSPPNSYGGIDDYKAILEGSELDLRKRFYQHRDSNSSGLRESDGTYSRAVRAEGERQYGKYSLDKFDPIDAVSAFFIADNQARIDKIKTGKDYETYTGEEGWVNPRLLEVQQRRRLGAAGAAIQTLMTDMFNDDATQETTDTDINSTQIDDQIIDKLVRRREIQVGSPAPAAPLTLPPLPEPFAPSDTITEAGAAGADIDNVLSRRGRGVQAGDIRGSYAKPKKIAADILGDIIGGAVDIAEAKPKKKR
jgi:hypothetical protein